MGVQDRVRTPAKRILVVDDEPTIREIVATALEEAGYQIDAAVNGADALRRMQRQVPDAIVLDLMMPVLDARGLLELIQLNPRLQQVPVLVISAAYGALEEARRLGARECLTKPFQLEDLVDAVARLVGPAMTVEPRLTETVPVRSATATSAF